MGNDGGSIPDRTSVIRVKKRKKKIHDKEIKKTKCNLCCMSKERLRKPIVGDRLGQIYNKKSIIEYLLSKNPIKDYEHIKSLKNVKELNCIINKQGYLQCGISQEEFSGLNKFYFLWGCGCLLSKTAIDELHMKDKCISCNKPIDINKDLISLNYDKSLKIKIQKKLLGLHNCPSLDKIDSLKDKVLNLDNEHKEIKLLNNKTKRNINKIEI